MATSIRTRQSSSRSSWRSPGDHDAQEAVHWLGTAGWTAKGVLYLLIGVIALLVAFGTATTTQQASKEGALQKLVHQPAGSFFLSAVTIGLLAYAAYRLLTILFDDAQGPELLGHAVARIGSAAVYLLAAIQGIALLVGSESPTDGSEAPPTWSATLIDSSVGTVLFIAVAVGIFGFAGYQLYVAFSKRFMDNLSCPAGSASSATTVVSIGMIGIAARAVVAALVGAFLLHAVITHDPNQAEGLDGSLRELQRTVMGPAILAVIAAGLASYALFCFFSSRMRHHADG